MNNVYVIFACVFLFSGCAHPLKQWRETRFEEINKSYAEGKLTDKERFELMNQVDTAIINYQAGVASKPSNFVYTYEIN